jgi:hypothetical protein
VGGWGAGTFAILHLRYRHDRLAVTQAHSGPVQVLAETGLVGLVLAYGGLLALLAAAIARTRRMPGGRARDITVALLAAAIAWFVHNFFDWDWNIPAVTAPVLAMLAIAAGRPLAPRHDPLPLSLSAPARPGRRYALVALAALLTAAALGSIVVPLVATSRSDAAAVETGSNTPATLQDAAAKADLAARLDPLSTRPLFVASAIALNRGRLLDARADLLEAAGRAPQDPEVWSRLAAIAVRLADWPGYLRATQRLFALDPHNPQATSGGSLALLLLASPADSATATGTPLVAGTTAPAPAGR